MLRARLATAVSITAVSLGLAVAVAACGGSHRPDTNGQASADTPGTATRLHRAALRYAQCMRANGVSNFQLNKLRSGALAMARCMRAHRVTNFPDPVVSAGPGGHGIQVRVGGGSGAGVDSSSPAFQSAQTACGHLLGGAIGVKASKAATQVGGLKQAGPGGGS